MTKMLRVFLCTEIANVNSMWKIWGWFIWRDAQFGGNMEGPKWPKTIVHPGCFIWHFTVIVPKTQYRIVKVPYYYSFLAQEKFLPTTARLATEYATLQIRIL